MLSSPGASRRRRRAFTLAESVIVLALAGVVLGIVTIVGTRLQHQMTNEAARLESNEQLGVAGELLPLELRALSPAAGDIAEATDSTIQYRATVANAVVCGGAGSMLLIGQFLGGAGRALVPAVQAGDTLWILTDNDTSTTWRPTVVAALRRVTGTCPFVDASSATVVDLRSLWAVDLREIVTAGSGTVIRVTRPQRLSFYRASDGRWYLGLRTWNGGAAQFNTVQPLSGPYASPTVGGGSRFKYFDSAARPMSLGVAAIRTIARIEAVLVDDGRTAADSQVVVIALRNR